MNIDAKDAALQKLLNAWSARGRGMIAHHLEDVRAHAGRAAFEIGIIPARGNPSIVAITSQSAARAENRFNILIGSLCDPATSNGLVQLARESFYVASFGYWKDLLHAGLHASNPAPRPADVLAARQAEIHGSSPASWMQGAFETARAALGKAIQTAAIAGTADRGFDLLNSWETNARSEITRAFGTLLCDSLTDAGRRAGLDVVEPRAVA